MSKAEKDKKVVLTPEQKAKAKRETFKRVVSPRVTKAIKAIHLVGNCAGNAYEYSDEQAKSICLALSTAVQTVEGAYTKKALKDAGFSLPS